MHFNLKSLTALIALTSLIPPAVAVRPEHVKPRPRVVPHQLRVKYRDRADRQAIRHPLSALELRGDATARHEGPTLVKLRDNQRAAAVLKKLRRNPAVQYAERIYYRYPATDRVIPNDPDFSQQWAWDNSGEASNSVRDADLDMPEAWAILRRAPDIKVAIIDDGFKLTHPDLASNFVPGGGVSCIKGDCSAEPDAAAQTDSADEGDEGEYHGTLVAGVLGAAGDNGIGITGAAWSLNLLPIRTDLRSDSLAAAVRYAVNHDATIINISVGGSGRTKDEKNALAYARDHDVLIVASAGNHDSNLDDAVLGYPANYQLPNIISAAASTRRDEIASFSQWGSFAVDVAAPGVDILTTTRDGGYAFAGGTSFASPATAGVAALVAQYLKDQTGVVPGFRAIKAHLLGGAEYSGSTGIGNLEGRTAAGRVNAHNALQPVDHGVLIIRGVTIRDDASLTADNNGNKTIDPGEHLKLVITLENIGNDEGDVLGKLVALNDITSAAPNQQDFGAMVSSGNAKSTATAAFPLNVNRFTGSHHLLFELTLDTAGGTVVKRYFYLNVGILENHTPVTETMQRTNWDEFQAWHITLPPGSKDLVVYTHTDNDVDIDLLAHYAAHPRYDITLGADPEDDAYSFATDEKTRVSGNVTGDESIGFAEKTQAGVYHIVAVNFDDFRHPYSIAACYAPPDSDEISFTGTNTEIKEDNDDGAVTVSVARSGSEGAASVDYQTRDGSATAGVNYQATSGTLEWADGDNAIKQISIPITATGTITSATESFRNFHVALVNPRHAKPGCVATTKVTLTGSEGATDKPGKPKPPPPPSTGNDGGGGGGGQVGLSGLLLLLLLVRRRRC